MARLGDICSHIRSKNAGPFWVTVDLFFSGPETFQDWKGAEGFSVEALAAAFDAHPADCRRIEAPELSVIKFSYPRPVPQGGVTERDMHSGQQYVRLLGCEV